jgi:hypothetical protein
MMRRKLTSLPACPADSHKNGGRVFLIFMADSRTIVFFNKGTQKEFGRPQNTP